MMLKVSGRVVDAVGGLPDPEEEEVVEAMTETQDVSWAIDTMMK